MDAVDCRGGMLKPSSSPAGEVVGAHRMVPLYQVVLLDDDDHTYDYIIEMLQAILIFTMAEGYRHAEELERKGRSVLMVCELEEAEFARDQIHHYGADWRLPRSQGSMSAIVERM